MNQTSRRSAIQVGIMGLLAVVVLLGGVVWVKEYRVGERKTTYTARFQEV